MKEKEIILRAICNVCGSYINIDHLKKDIQFSLEKGNSKVLDGNGITVKCGACYHTVPLQDISVYNASIW